jgi:hypothetical protein
VGKNEKAWHSKGDARLYFFGQFIKALKKTGVTSKYYREKGVMKKLSLEKREGLMVRRMKLQKNNYQLGS